MKRKETIAPLLSAALSTAGEAVEIHRKFSSDVHSRLAEFSQATQDLTDSCQKLSTVFKEYSDVLTNEAEPEVALARKGAIKMRDLFDRMASIFVEATKDIMQTAQEPYQRLVEVTIAEARDSTRRAMAMASAYDAVKRKNGEAVARRRSSAAQLKQAQEEQEAARTAYVKAEKESLAAHATACNSAYIQCPKTFTAFFGTFARMIEQGTTIVQDMEPYNHEFAHAARELEAAADSAGTIAQTPHSARKEAVVAIIEQEQQYVGVLTVVSQMRQRVIADKAALKISDEDVLWIFSKVPAIAVLHGDMLAKLQKAAAASASAPSPASDPVSLTIAQIVSDALPTMEDLYVPYIENQTRAAASVEQLRKTKHFVTLMKSFEQSCALAGMAVFDFLSMLSVPCRHVHKLKLALQLVMDNTPTDDKGWNALHDVIERTSELIDKFDEARVQSENIKQLLRVREKLPTEDIVDGSRNFLYDGDLLVIAHSSNLEPTMLTPPSIPTSTSAGNLSALAKPPPLVAPVPAKSKAGAATTAALPPPAASTGTPASPAKPGASSLPPLPPQLPRTSPDAVPPTPRTAAALQQQQQQLLQDQITAGHHFHIWLFNDLFLVTRGKKKGLEQSTYKVFLRVPVPLLAVVDLGEVDVGQGKFPFRVDYPKGSIRFAATSEEQRSMWVNTLGRAIVERKKTQVFGVPLGELMRRPSERNREVPQILEDAVTYIRRAGQNVEGVFRISSSSTDTAHLITRIDSGKPVRFNEIHNTTGTLKAWLRALPAPLMTFELYSDWIDAIGDVQKLRTCVSRLPRANRYVLASLIGLLKQIAEHSTTNMMDSHNLAIVIAPNILYAKGTADYLKSSDPCSVVDSLISQYDRVFTETVTEQEALRTSISAQKTEASHSRRERLKRLASKKEISIPEMNASSAQPSTQAGAPLLTITQAVASAPATATASAKVPAVATTVIPAEPHIAVPHQPTSADALKIPTTSDGSDLGTESHGSEGSASSYSAQMSPRRSNASDSALPELVKVPTAPTLTSTPGLDSSTSAERDGPSPVPELADSLPRIIAPQASPIVERAAVAVSAPPPETSTAATPNPNPNPNPDLETAKSDSPAPSTSLAAAEAAEKKHKHRHRHTISGLEEGEDLAGSSRRRRGRKTKVDTLGRPRQTSVDSGALVASTDQQSDEEAPETIVDSSVIDPEKLTAVMSSVTHSVIGTIDSSSDPDPVDPAPKTT